MFVGSIIETKTSKNNIIHTLISVCRTSEQNAKDCLQVSGHYYLSVSA